MSISACETATSLPGHSQGGGRGAVVVAGGVQLLLCDQIGFGLVDSGKPREAKMGVFVGGGGALDFLLVARRLGCGAFDVLFEFGNFQSGQHVTLLDLVADVHVDGFDEAGDFCVEINFLVRTKLGVERLFLRHVRPRDPDNGHSDGRGRIFGRTGSAVKGSQSHEAENRSRREQQDFPIEPPRQRRRRARRRFLRRRGRRL